MGRNVTRSITAGAYNQDIDKRLARIGLATRDYQTASLILCGTVTNHFSPKFFQ